MDLFEFEASMIYRAVRHYIEKPGFEGEKKQASKQTTINKQLTKNKQLGKSRKYLKQELILGSPLQRTFI